MTHDEQRRALELLGKLTGLDETTSVEVRAFLKAVTPPAAPANGNTVTERIRNRYKEWIDMAVEKIAERAACAAYITADDMGDLTPPSKGCMGAAFRRASSLGLIRQVALCQTEREAGHLLRRWELMPCEGY